ncbi:MAG: hypothetical protein MRERC_5c055 [Mycoplasmataceae bacterium RC_NB112A]|nr:MAG: hypothetical protein MRERC_5c055 [Mycoplasmataceae bacterium RC_NB112A]
MKFYYQASENFLWKKSKLICLMKWRVLKKNSVLEVENN